MKPENRKRLKYIILSIFLTSAYILLAAQYPQWWITRGVINANSPMTNDYAAVTQGQVKWMAKGAYEEMQAYGGAGSAISDLISSFSLSNNYLSVNQGQLKYVASLFYDRFYSWGVSPFRYPWEHMGLSAPNDYEAVNVGQVKYLFSFEYDNSGSGDGVWRHKNIHFNNDDKFSYYGTNRTDIIPLLISTNISSTVWNGTNGSVIMSCTVGIGKFSSDFDQFYLSSDQFSGAGWNADNVKLRIESATDTNDYIFPQSDSIHIDEDLLHSWEDIKISLIFTGQPGNYFSLGPIYILRWTPEIIVNGGSGAVVLCGADNYLRVTLALKRNPPTANWNAHVYCFNNGNITYGISGFDMDSNHPSGHISIKADHPSATAEEGEIISVKLNMY